MIRSCPDRQLPSDGWLWAGLAPDTHLRTVAAIAWAGVCPHRSWSGAARSAPPLIGGSFDALVYAHCARKNRLGQARGPRSAGP